MNSKFKQIVFIVSLIVALLALAIYVKPQKSSTSNQQTATSASTTPNMTVLDVLPGVGFNQKLTLTDENGLNEAGKHYALTLTSKESSYLSDDPEQGFFIYDDKGAQAQINRAFSISLDNVAEEEDQNEIWFDGKPDTAYTLVFRGYDADYNEVESKTEFKTPTEPSNLKAILATTEKSIQDYLKIDLNKALKDSIDSDHIWENMAPYYTPSTKEKEAIAQAYWETFIKNWTISQLQMTRADSSYYGFRVTYQWADPDIDELNKRIEARESALKTELGDDYKKMFQTITKEIPDMIRNTPRKNNTEEYEKDVWIRRERFEDPSVSGYFSSLFDDFIKPLDRLYP